MSLVNKGLWGFGESRKTTNLFSVLAKRREAGWCGNLALYRIAMATHWVMALSICLEVILKASLYPMPPFSAFDPVLKLFDYSAVVGSKLNNSITINSTTNLLTL